MVFSGLQAATEAAAFVLTNAASRRNVEIAGDICVSNRNTSSNLTRVFSSEFPALLSTDQKLTANLVES
jgi:hypothetical protein